MEVHKRSDDPYLAPEDTNGLDLPDIALDPTIEVHAFFRPENFAFYSNQQYDFLLPCLQVASVIVQSHRSLAFSHCIFFAKVRYNEFAEGTDPTTPLGER